MSLLATCLIITIGLSMPTQHTTSSVNTLPDPVFEATIMKGKPPSVVFVAFRVFKKDNICILQWSTSMEFKNLGFEIERSGDSRTWKSIGLVSGQIKSLDYVDYQYSHCNPLDGTNYYRLRQMNYDRSFTYSRVAKLKGKSPTVRSYINYSALNKSLVREQNP